MLLRILAFWIGGSLIAYFGGPLASYILCMLVLVVLIVHGLDGFLLSLIIIISWIRCTPLVNTRFRGVEELYAEVKIISLRNNGGLPSGVGKVLYSEDSRWIGRLVYVGQLEDVYSEPPFILYGSSLHDRPVNDSSFEFDVESWYRGNGWYGKLQFKDLQLKPLRKSGLQEWKVNIRDRILGRPWSQSRKRLALALLLGEGRALGPKDRAPFVSTGTAHVLAVSGLHVGMIYILILASVRPFSDLKIRRVILLVSTVIGLFMYSWFTGNSPSVVRSSIMFIGWTASQVLERDRYSLNGLFLAALISLIIWPYWVFSAGFHLSYAAVCAILLGLKKWPAPSHWDPRIKRALMIAQVTLLAQAGTLAISASYFGQFPTYFLFANLILNPMIPIILYVAWICLIMSATCLSLCGWIDWVWETLVDYIYLILENISGWPVSLIDLDINIVHAFILALLSWSIVLRLRLPQWISIGIAVLILVRIDKWFL